MIWMNSDCCLPGVLTFQDYLLRTTLPPKDLNNDHIVSFLLWPPSGMPFEDHHPSITLQTQRFLCLRRPEQSLCATSSPVSLMTGHFKTILEVQLYWLKGICVLGDLNECAVSSPVSLPSALQFQDHQPIITPPTQRVLCSMKSEQCAVSSPVVSIISHF